MKHLLEAIAASYGWSEFNTLKHVLFIAKRNGESFRSAALRLL